jgi:hypothetical protein
MKVYLGIWIVLLFSSSINFSQEINYEFIGNLKADSGQSLSYKLQFSENKPGAIVGVSITDFYGQNSTTSEIVGTIDRAKKTISFRETRNLSTKSNADGAIFCYVSVTNLSIDMEGGNHILKGDFIGYYNNGEKCAGGQIMLAGAAKLESMKPGDLNANMDSVGSVSILDLVDFKDALNRSAKISHGDSKRIHWTSEKIVLIVWDGYYEDHDKINIYLNGRLKYKNLEALQKKRILEIPFTGDSMEIKIEAVNNGTSPPNTVNALLVDGENNLPFQTQLKKGESAIILLAKD